MANNSKGKIGIEGVYKNITKRSIGVGSEWKDQDFKFIGERGYWRLVYTKTPINISAPFVLRYLEGYSLERENSLAMFGSNFKEYQLISPKIGAYFEMNRNASDFFENFASGVYYGAPAVGVIVGKNKSTEIKTTSDYFQLPNDLDAIGVFGSTGTKDYNIGQHVYINALPASGIFIPCLSFGDRSKGMEIVITSDGRLQQKIWKNELSELTQSPAGSISVGWNSYVITKVSSLTKMFIGNAYTPVATSSFIMSAANVSTPIKAFTSYRFASSTPLEQAFSLSKLQPKYTLSNSNKTATTVAVGYTTMRSNNIIQSGTGKYYFEIKNDLITGVSWVGLADSNISSSSAVGTSGWSISSNSRFFNKQGGGGTTWGGGNNGFTTGDIIGCVYNSGLGTATWYKNNVLMGTSTSAITGPVEFMMCSDNGGVSTIRIKSTEWTYASPDAQAIQMPPLLISSGLENYSTIGSAFRYLYVSSNVITEENIDKLMNRKDPDIIIKNKSTSIETALTESSILSITDDKITVTIPVNTQYGNYELFVRYFSGAESYRFPISVSEILVRDTPFTDDFSDPKTLSDNYYVLNRAWGGANGGVVQENVFLKNGKLILRANGDNYSGSIQGVDRDGVKKEHTIAEDPKIGQPWTNRVGGCIVYNKKTGFGSYEIETMIPNNLGVAYAMWTFFYNEVYPSSPSYDVFLNDENLHEQGSAEDGYYITRNHEIDIEFPSHLDGGTLSDPSLSNMKCNTWKGELQNWDVPIGDPAYWEEYRDNLTPVGFNIADGNYHKLRFDWYPDRVEFYIDDVLKRINIDTIAGDTIPDIPGYFTFGVWFPSSPLPEKKWLVNPTKSWGGGVLDTDGGMKAYFDSVDMIVSKFTFTPFLEYDAFMRKKGETYPFGGYAKKL
jgi:hypothetical protein